MTDTTRLPARSEVPVEQTWALESIFATPADWEAACKTLEQLLPGLTAYQGRLKEGPQVLLEAIQKLEEAGTLLGKIMTYANNASAVDTFDQAATARAGQARSLGARAGAAMAFFDPELMSIGFDRLKQWIETTPELAFFAHYVDRLEQRSLHVRSGEVEEVLALAGDPFSGAYSIFNMLNNADLKFQPATGIGWHPATKSGRPASSSLITHADREVRRTAWQNYADGYLAFKNTSAATLTTAIKQDVFNARVRGYASSLHASLEPNNIPVEVFHNLIEVFKSNLPTWHHYWRLRRKALKLDTFGVYDIKAPLTRRQTGGALRAGGGLDLRGHGAAGRGICHHPAPRLPGRALGGPGPQQRQARRRLLQRHRLARARSS